MTPIQQLYLGVGAKKKTYIEDLFSNYAYSGNSSTRSITTNVDMTKGGLVWIKSRTTTDRHNLFDTERGVGRPLYTNESIAETGPDSTALTAFNSNGWSIGADGATNATNQNYISYNFRKSKKFFDVVTYTGNGSNRLISHNLGSVPGFYVVKKRDSQASWNGYHRSLGKTKRLYIGSFAAEDDAGDSFWNDTAPTSTTFSLGTDDEVNNDGGTYVCYLFAHNDGDGNFGDSGDKDIIKCGSYTGNGSSGTSGPNIDLGWQPQFLLVKCADSGSTNWRMYDTMRGMEYNGSVKVLFPNTSSADYTYSDRVNFHAKGFQITGTSSQVNTNGDEYVYIAIRGVDGSVGKIPELGTSAFTMDTGASSGFPRFDSNSPVDLGVFRQPGTSEHWYTSTRITGANVLRMNEGDAQAANTNSTFDSNVGWHSSAGTSYQSWMWTRGPGFDLIPYTGDGNDNRTIYHSLNKTVEMMWTKVVDKSGEHWAVWHHGFSNGIAGTNASNKTQVLMTLNGEDAQAGDNSFYGGSNGGWPNSSSWTIGDADSVNKSGYTYIAMAFTSIEGICKVGSYVGDGTNDGSHEITLGFSPRFLIIKCRDGNEPWTVFDTTRGFASGSDNYLRLNTNDAQSSGDKVDPTSTGFKLMDNTGPWNDSPGKTYLYYAHA